MSTESRATTMSGADASRLVGVSRAKLWVVLLALVLLLEIAPLQYLMLFPLVTHVARAFHVGADANWMMIIMGLVGGAFTPLIGKMSDLYGKKRMLLGCIAVCLVGTVLCLAASSTQWWLFLVGRGLQSFGITVTTVGIGLIRDLFPRRMVPVAVGVTGAGLGITSVIAPVVTGWLIGSDEAAYKPAFWFMLVFLAVSVVPFVLLVPETKIRLTQRPDYAGAFLLAGGAALVLLYLSRGGEWGWTSGTGLICVLGGLVLLTGFVVLEQMVESPIIDPALLLHPRMTMVLGLALFGSIVAGTYSTIAPIIGMTPGGAALHSSIAAGTAASPQMQAAHLTAADVTTTFHGDVSYGQGFTLLSYSWHIALAGAVIATIAGPLCGYYGSLRGMRKPLLFGFVAFAFAAGMQAVWHSSWVALLSIGCLWSVGFGIFFAAPQNLTVDAVPASRQGAGMGILNVANGFGPAIAGAVLTAFASTRHVTVAVAVKGAPGGRSVDLTETHGVFDGHVFTLMYVFAAICAVVAFGFAFVMKTGRTAATGGLDGDSLALAEPVVKVAVPA